jgi:hypothetical protein
MATSPTPRRGELPPLAEIGRIEPEQNRFYKVLNHLLNRKECWYLVCPGLSPHPRDEARRAGCPASCLQERVHQFERTPEACRKHLLGAHDLHLEPAYRRALDSADRRRALDPALQRGCLAFAAGDTKAAVAVGDEGVFVVLRRSPDSGRWRVATAYRPKLKPEDGPPRTNKAFFNAALRKWDDKTTLPAKVKP